MCDTQMIEITRLRTVVRFLNDRNEAAKNLIVTMDITREQKVTLLNAIGYEHFAKTL